MNCVTIKVDWSDTEKGLLSCVSHLMFVMKAQSVEPLEI